MWPLYLLSLKVIIKDEKMIIRDNEAISSFLTTKTYSASSLVFPGMIFD